MGRAHEPIRNTVGLITDNREAIAALCDCFGVEVLDVFGSAVSGAFDESSSDVDFISSIR